MDPPTLQFVVTPWRSSEELLQLRRDLYGSDALKKERAVNKVFAWRSRKPDGLPLLLESTADIVDVILQDEKNELKHNPTRLLYATALSRFITGLADTQIDLIRDKPSWFPPGKTLQLPSPLLEIRHRIVHRHLPSLAELKRAAQDSLSWLWEWYWLQLDHAFALPLSATADIETESPDTTRERLHTLLKTYVKDRIAEIKTRKKEKGSRAAQTAVASYARRYAPSATSVPPARSQKVLLQLLVNDKMILPTDKKIGSSMSGAFLIWDSLFLAFVAADIISVSQILETLINAMNAQRSEMVSVDVDPVKEGLCEWIVHVLQENVYCAKDKVESVLATCFSEPTFWNVRVAERLVDGGDVRDGEAWREVLRAARDEDMDMDMETEIEGGEVKEVGMEKTKVKEKIRGPVKVIGMWKPKPIGCMEGGWQDDE